VAFPQTPLPVSVFIAPGGNPTDSSTWAWRDITTDVRAASGIRIDAGRRDEGAQVDASSCTLTIDNRSGNYSPRNPLGTWYGQLRKNTPLHVRVTRGTDTFSRTTSPGWGTADTGQTWTHTTSSVWSTNGTVGQCAEPAANSADFAIMSAAGTPDVDMTYTASLSAVATGAAWVSAAVVRYTDTSNFYRVHTEFGTGGVISAKIEKTVAGAVTTLFNTTATAVTYVAGTQVKSRVQADGGEIRLKIWAAAGSEPDAWNAVVTDGDLTGVGAGFYMWRVAGNTNVGTMTCSVDDVAISAILFTGTVPEWPVRWDQTGNDSTTPIVAAGVLRRLGQGASPLRSPIYRQLSQYSPAGYWPLEDGSDATTASSGVTGGAAASVTDVTFGTNDTLNGAASVVKLNTHAASKIYGRVSGPNTADGYAGMCYFRLATLPGSKQTLMEFGATGTVTRWVISTDGTGFVLDGYDSDGTSVVSTGTTIYVADPTQWVAVQLETNKSGGTINWTLIWHQVGGSTFWSTSGSYAGTATRITSVTLLAPTDGTLVAHAWAGDNDLPFVDTTFALVSNGYSGELARDRAIRLCGEEGMPVVVEPGTSSAMGPQRIATFLDLLRAVEAADLGVVSERGPGLAYRARGARYSKAVEMALDFSAGHVGDPPEPTDDDQNMRNDITVSRDNGGSARVVDAAHVAAYGRYDDSATINVATDDDLGDQAGWRLHLGTWDEMRWPLVTLNLAANPTLISSWVRRVIGSRMTVANPPSQIAGVSVDVLIEGWTQTLTPYGWDVELNCSPARVWDVGVLDDASARMDTDGSTLAAGATSSATSLSVATTAAGSPLWTTAAGDFPFDVNVAGERMTVTNITGGSSPQTFTVTRSVNGVVKAQASAADVRLWTPAYLAL
jgi:hypothetical protein